MFFSILTLLLVEESSDITGQSILRQPIHVIPCYMGDVENPWGGVRGVIPDRKHYTSVTDMAGCNFALYRLTHGYRMSVHGSGPRAVSRFGLVAAEDKRIEYNSVQAAQ